MGRFGHMEGCKCMTCAGDRYQAAEVLARQQEPDKYFDYVRRGDELDAQIAELERDRKAVTSGLRDLVMNYYNEANYGKS